jgi:cytochrome c-type biogenesis protein CcmH/NrfF
LEEISNKSKVNDFTNMLKDVRQKVSQMIEDGKSLEEIIAS